MKSYEKNEKEKVSFVKDNNDIDLSKQEFQFDVYYD